MSSERSEGGAKGSEIEACLLISISIYICWRCLYALRTGLICGHGVSSRLPWRRDCSLCLHEHMASSNTWCSRQLGMGNLNGG